MKNMIIRLLGGFTSQQVKEDYVLGTDYDRSYENNVKLSERVARNKELLIVAKNQLKNSEMMFRRLNNKHSEDHKTYASEIKRITEGWSKDLDKLNLINKDYKIQRSGYSRVRTRNQKVNNILTQIEVRSTKGKSVRWLDYDSYNILGDDLLKIKRVLNGDNKQ